LGFRLTFTERARLSASRLRQPEIALRDVDGRIRVTRRAKHIETIGPGQCRSIVITANCFGFPRGRANGRPAVMHRCHLEALVRDRAPKAVPSRYIVVYNERLLLGSCTDGT
jgi:hypothetical protein